MHIKINETKQPHKGDLNDLARKRQPHRTPPPSKAFGEGYDMINFKGVKRVHRLVKHSQANLPGVGDI